jgi:hypothetical protein
MFCKFTLIKESVIIIFLLFSRAKIKVHIEIHLAQKKYFRITSLKFDPGMTSTFSAKMKMVPLFMTKSVFKNTDM